MKKKWLQSLGGVDNKYVAEAAPAGAARKRSGKSVRMVAILAACLAFILLAGTFALFIPYPTTPPNVSAYANSQYYGIIQKLNEYNYRPPEYKNTFDMLVNTIPNMFKSFDNVSGAAPESAPPNEYREITDNQVSGVIEADLIKRSDSHIFYLASGVLYIYSIQGEDSQKISTYEVNQYGVTGFTAEEFFLSLDCKTLTVISSYVDKSSKKSIPFVKVITLDVSDPALIQEISNVDVSGQYLSSRLTEHGLLLMTTMRCNNPDYDDERTYIPQVETADGMQSLALDSIISPDKLSNASYTVMLLMNDVGSAVKDTAAYLSYSQDVYVSADAIYATRQYTEFGEAINAETPYSTRSEISCLGYGADGFEKRGSITVDGYVLDQYSMDQYEGTLRVVTTTQTGVQRRHSNAFGGYNSDLMVSFNGNTSANLYVIDLATMKIAASVEQFAPIGETVRSARFDGTQAYVCTAIQQTDPVFFFDLSDLDNITVKETGTIEGFSTSLVNFGDGFLLGIGQESGGTLKLEIYTEGEQDVQTYCKLVLLSTEYYPDYKCYYIDRENGLIGLGIHTWDRIELEEYHAFKYENFRYGYIVLHFDGQSISEVLRIEYGQNDLMQQMRGVYIDGYYYVLNGDHFDVKPLELES